jgi:hypothetical protein
VKIDAEITPIVIKISPVNICPLFSLRFETRDKTTPPKASNIAINFVAFNFSIWKKLAIIIVHTGMVANTIPALPEVVNSSPNVRQIGKPEK